MVAKREVVLDTCVLVNLLASGECEDILRSANSRWIICSAVENESIYLRSNDPATPLELIDLAPFISSSLLSVCDIENDEEAQLYVNYASQLEDGEAMSLAIALARGYGLATDERKAKRLFIEAVNAPERLVGTSQILKSWVCDHAITNAKSKNVLRQISERARFFPPTTDPFHQWWNDLCA